MVHGEEGHAEVLRILLVPSEAGEGDPRAAVGQSAHGPVLRGELGIEEEQVLGRGHPDDQAPLLAVGGAGAAEDRLVGEAVGAGGLHVEDLGAGSVGRLGRQPAREDGGHLVGVTLADVGHGAALYRPGPTVREGQGDGGRVASQAVLIVIDLSEATRLAAPSPTNSPASPWPSRAKATWPGWCRGPAWAASPTTAQHVVVDPGALRALAGPAADERWEEGFAGMCAYAAGKGWVEPDGGVLAHIEPAARRAEPPAGGSRGVASGLSGYPRGRRYPWGVGRPVRRGGRAP